MSIIYDALKKTQKHLERKTQPTSTPPSSPSSPLALPPDTKTIPAASDSTTGKKPMFSVIAIVLISGFAICAVLFFAKAMQNRLTPISSAQQQDIQTEPVDIDPQPELQPMPVDIQLPEPQDAQPALVLSGIIYTDDDQLALINNQIYRTGELVEGKKIIRITPDKVELSNEGVIEVLKTK